MFNDTFKKVLTHNGVVSITTWTESDVHVSNTWNVYLHLKSQNRILIPAAWLNRTEKNININNKVIMTLGSPNVQGKLGMGAGFVIRGTAKFITSGEEFDMMKEKFPFLTRVMDVTATSVKQTI